VLGALVASCGDLDLAEDSFQDAVATALERWPREGVPLRPAAWLTTAARRRAIDRLRHGAMRAARAPRCAKASSRSAPRAGTSPTRRNRTCPTNGCG
jgi:RNA polymerase sigma-70 factor (ECF subfamily)